MTRPPLIRTRLTARYGLRSPILNAPMALVAGGALAAAVSRAGGLGLIGGGYAGTPRTFAFAPREKPAAQRAGEGLPQSGAVPAAAPLTPGLSPTRRAGEAGRAAGG